MINGKRFHILGILLCESLAGLYHFSTEDLYDVSMWSPVFAEVFAGGLLAAIWWRSLLPPCPLLIVLRALVPVFMPSGSGRKAGYEQDDAGVCMRSTELSLVTSVYDSGNHAPPYKFSKCIYTYQKPWSCDTWFSNLLIPLFTSEGSFFRVSKSLPEWWGFCRILKKSDISMGDCGEPVSLGTFAVLD